MSLEILKKAVEAVESYVFPSALYCISCGALIDKSRTYQLCDDCIENFKWSIGDTCEICGKPLSQTKDERRSKFCYDCKGTGHHFDRGYSCFGYGTREKEPIIALKYHSSAYVAKPLGDIAYDRIMQIVREKDGEIFFDCIIPIPLHPKRQALRGYNQAELIGRRLAELMGIPQLTDVLLRVKETQKMKALDSLNRFANIEGAFAVSKKGRQKLQGKRVLILDDIYTTGATADEAARTLKEAGATRVYLLTLAAGSNYYRQT